MIVSGGDVDGEVEVGRRCLGITKNFKRANWLR